MHDSSHPSVCAIIVTHFPDDGFNARCEALLMQVIHLYIMDNSLNSDEYQKLEQLASQHPDRITLYKNEKNNLARAQNMGIRHAQQAGYAYVLLLDDDSEPAEDMMEQLLLAHHHHPHPETIGLIAPKLQHINGHTQHYVCSKKGWWPHRICITTPSPGVIDNLLFVIASGSLIPTIIFSKISMMDEALSIDYIDQDFCLRLRRAGYRILLAPHAQLQHRVGASKTHNLGNVSVTATHHSPARRYTIYRNRIITWRRYGFSFPAFLLYDIMAALYDIYRITLFEKQKTAKYRAIMRGVWHGVRYKNTI